MKNHPFWGVETSICYELKAGGFPSSLWAQACREASMKALESFGSFGMIRNANVNPGLMNPVQILRGVATKKWELF